MIYVCFESIDSASSPVYHSLADNAAQPWSMNMHKPGRRASIRIYYDLKCSQVTHDTQEMNIMFD